MQVEDAQTVKATFLQETGININDWVNDIDNNFTIDLNETDSYQKVFEVGLFRNFSADYGMDLKIHYGTLLNQMIVKTASFLYDYRKSQVNLAFFPDMMAFLSQDSGSMHLRALAPIAIRHLDEEHSPEPGPVRLCKEDIAGDEAQIRFYDGKVTSINNVDDFFLDGFKTTTIESRAGKKGFLFFPIISSPFPFAVGNFAYPTSVGNLSLNVVAPYNQDRRNYPSTTQNSILPLVPSQSHQIQSIRGIYTAALLACMTKISDEQILGVLLAKFQQYSDSVETFAIKLFSPLERQSSTHSYFNTIETKINELSRALDSIQLDNIAHVNGIPLVNQQGAVSMSGMKGKLATLGSGPKITLANLQQDLVQGAQSMNSSIKKRRGPGPKKDREEEEIVLNPNIYLPAGLRQDADHGQAHGQNGSVKSQSSQPGSTDSRPFAPTYNSRNIKTILNTALDAQQTYESVLMKASDQVADKSMRTPGARFAEAANYLSGEAEARQNVKDIIHQMQKQTRDVKEAINQEQPDLVEAIKKLPHIQEQDILVKSLKAKIDAEHTGRDSFFTYQIANGVRGHSFEVAKSHRAEVPLKVPQAKHLFQVFEGGISTFEERLGWSYDLHPWIIDRSFNMTNWVAEAFKEKNTNMIFALPDTMICALLQKVEDIVLMGRNIQVSLLTADEEVSFKIEKFVLAVYFDEKEKIIKYKKVEYIDPFFDQKPEYRKTASGQLNPLGVEATWGLPTYDLQLMKKIKDELGNLNGGKFHLLPSGKITIFPSAALIEKALKAGGDMGKYFVDLKVEYKVDYKFFDMMMCTPIFLELLCDYLHEKKILYAITKDEITKSVSEAKRSNTNESFNRAMFSGLLAGSKKISKNKYKSSKSKRSSKSKSKFKNMQRKLYV